MILYPAIDILGGSAVRLLRGDFQARKTYDQDPLAAARRWVRAGARALHVVDLDGARAGEPQNLEHVRRIARELEVTIQLGGGLRSAEAIAAALEAGAARVILGTAAFADPELLERALATHGAERVMVSIDARSGGVVSEGWAQATGREVGEVFADVLGRGARELLYTSVDRDGTLEGVAEQEVRAAAQAAAGARLIYSGGIGSVADLRLLAALAAELESLAGVIVGKALYEERFTVAQAEGALAAGP